MTPADAPRAPAPPGPSGPDLAGVRAKLVDYLRAEAIRLLVEQAEARERAVQDASHASGAAQDDGRTELHAPVPIRIGAPPRAEVDPAHAPSSAPFVLGRAMLRPSDPLMGDPLHRRPSAPSIMARRGSTASATSTAPSTSPARTPVPGSAPLSTLLARARANIAADLLAHAAPAQRPVQHSAQAQYAPDDKSWMVAEVGSAFVGLDEKFRRWTEEVTARALRVR